MEPRRPNATRVPYELRVGLQSVVDLSSEASFSAVNLSMDDLRSDGFSACKRVGGAVAWLGHDGILVPSVRSPDSKTPNPLDFKTPCAANSFHQSRLRVARKIL